ncbi:hypothetical protein BD289DRAFT_448780 [Coniella lustricola]|uniref:Uncharacterized protein n=1 Tax=Coniella lustricola TaxID=2025994 RepID=A0A2T2ZRV6_9PEZI|nr:hypothetical protein BD289DRAFT_448780 [Coniella lustricola]
MSRLLVCIYYAISNRLILKSCQRGRLTYCDRPGRRANDMSSCCPAITVWCELGRQRVCQLLDVDTVDGVSSDKVHTLLGELCGMCDMWVFMDMGIVGLISCLGAAAVCSGLDIHIGEFGILMIMDVATMSFHKVILDRDKGYSHLNGWVFGFVRCVLWYCTV